MSENKRKGHFDLVVLISGSGTNLQAIIDAINNDKLQPARIILVISNKKKAYGLVRAQESGIPTMYLPFLSKKMDRHEYEGNLAGTIISQGKPNLVVCAGWMHILGPEILEALNNLDIPIINLHPALPGMWPGKDAIGDAWSNYQNGGLNQTGVMIHEVIPEIDAGKVITTDVVMIEDDDTEESLREKVRTVEKPALLRAIRMMIEEEMKRRQEEVRSKIFDSKLEKTFHQTKVKIQKQFSKMQAEAEPREDSQNQVLPRVEEPDELQNGQVVTQLQSRYNVYRGKVRDVWDLGFGKLAMVHSNRFSSFDRNITNVPNKGRVLNLTSKWWFERTEGIIKNHMLQADKNVMLVEKCDVIPIEVVLRAYITGSTSTSLWTHYSKGVRNYCGIQFPDGLVKNQKLDRVVNTPTTKGEVDIPISAKEIIEQNICTVDEWQYICQKAFELFEFASQVGEQAGYILVDTKMEFGRNRDGEIILIDEVFTCDSSRWWNKETYQERFDAALAPESLDKDLIREYVKARCNPYQDEIPEIPSALIEFVEQSYIDFYTRLTGNKHLSYSFQVNSDEFKDRMTDEEVEDYCLNYLSLSQNPFVLILSGSTKDREHVLKIKKALEDQNIYSQWQACSAHKETSKLLFLLEEHMEDVEFNNRKMAIICVAGLSNALGAVTACNSNVPVISCPPFKDASTYLIDIHSSLRNPSNVPVSVILNPSNCALYVARWFKMAGWI